MLTLIGNSLMKGYVAISTLVIHALFTCDDTLHTVDSELPINSATFNG